MMGHSLGGTSAALFLSGNKDETFKGIVFLASYPNRELTDSYRYLSIYGTNDTVLNKTEYEKNRTNFPAKTTEIVIDGGNHSYFDDHGFQRGDGVASISRDEQTRQTKNAVVDFIVNPSSLVRIGATKRKKIPKKNGIVLKFHAMMRSFAMRCIEHSGTFYKSRQP